MDDILKRELNTSKLENLGSCAGGCISNAEIYNTDNGKIFVKINNKSEARRMFDGELASLAALSETDIVKTPKPYKVIDLPKGGSALVMEYLDLSRPLSKHSAKLGQLVARLHLHNASIKQNMEKTEGSVHKNTTSLKYIDKFGFDVPTCCGFLPQSNQWQDTWIKFYGNKIEEQICLSESEYGDREVRQLWNTLLPNLHKLFTELDDIQPSLLHGDLWGGNAAETKDEPVIYDPASFYGHSEYDLAISNMFGGFGRDFFKAYHDIIPKANGHRHRLELYKLFHYLNHWNHFGGGYRNSSVSILKSLISETR